MKSNKWISKVLIIAFVLAFGVLCAFNGPINNAAGTLWSLFPPVVAIGLALITKEVYSSLFVGILMGGLLAAKFNPLKTMDTITNDGFISAISGTAGIFAFLVILGIIVALINQAGGSRAFGNWAAKHVKTKIGASLATFVFGVLIFIDDYFNCLTVGAVMRPVTDKAKISRSKLAYLIDATAAPICMIAPISSWAAAVTGIFEEEGINADGFAYFLNAIPYNLYSLMTFVFIIAITLMKFDYGPMKLHEKNADKGDLFTTGERATGLDEKEEGSPKAKVIDLIFPILALIGICVFALIYIGRDADHLSIIAAFGNTDATVALPWGGLLALLVIVVYFICRRIVSFKQAMECIPKGFIAMVPAILILTMATALKNMTGMLDSDSFVKGALASAGALSSFLPAIIFLVACGISFSTGTSWGTFGILIPIVLHVFPLGSEMAIIGMSACLAGSVCGDHCSPISDTTIMSSAGAQCNHINHVSTQLPYTLTVAGISLAGYLLAGFVQNVYIVLGFTTVLTVGILFLLKYLNREKA